MTERDDYWYHLGYADGEGSMENINPNAEKWHAIEQMGFDRAKSRVLYYHKPRHIPGNPKALYPREFMGYDVCAECIKDWPCPTALIFLPELDTTPLPPGFPVVD